MIQPVSLLSVEGLHRILTGLVTNFTSFAPLGTVLVALIGIGVAEASGLIGAAMRLLVLKSPRSLLTPVVVFCGVLSNAASEVGYVLLVPLAALIFKAAGRQPVLGLAAAFAGVSGGYSASASSPSRTRICPIARVTVLQPLAARFADQLEEGLEPWQAVTRGISSAGLSRMQAATAGEFFWKSAIPPNRGPPPPSSDSTAHGPPCGPAARGPPAVAA